MKIITIDHGFSHCGYAVFKIVEYPKLGLSLLENGFVVYMGENTDYEKPIYVAQETLRLGLAYEVELAIIEKFNHYRYKNAEKVVRTIQMLEFFLLKQGLGIEEIHHNHWKALVKKASYDPCLDFEIKNEHACDAVKIGLACAIEKLESEIIYDHRCLDCKDRKTSIKIKENQRKLGERRVSS